MVGTVDAPEPDAARQTTCGVLGPVVVGIDDRPVRNPRHRRLLVALLLADSGGLSLDALVEQVWDDDLPADPTSGLRVYVHRLRAQLPDRDAIVTEAGRYRLRPEALRTDAEEFERLLGLQAEVDDAVRRARILRAALGLWRGDPFGDLAVVPWVQPEATRLGELRWSATEMLLAARNDLDEHAAVAAEAAQLLTQAPYREGLRRTQMLALYRAGRQADALAAYEAHRDLLGEHLGLDASPELQRLERLILVQDPSLASPEGAGRRLRGYRIAERIGRGPASVVHRAAQPTIGREVAMKIIGDDVADHPTFIRRFDTDARAVARLEHPHVVPLLDYWREPGRAYLVSRLMRGGSLAESLAEGPWRPEMVATLAEQVGGALDMAHRRGITHGDVSASNVLLDEDGRAYIGDFGVATGAYVRAAADQATQLHARANFIAPEQAAGSPAGPVSDVYSLALVIVTALTGRIPTQSGRRGVRASLTAIDLPGDVRTALHRATDTDPSTRTPSIGELVAGLRPLADAPVSLSMSSPPVDNPYRGLEAFDVADAPRFHGRDGVVGELVRHLRVRRVLAIVGPSGSGKSSVLNAGLLPALAAGAIAGSEDWLVARMVPGDAPLEALELALASVHTSHSADAGALGDDPDVLWRSARAACGDSGTLLLAIDQFEELWGPAVGVDERDHVIGLIVTALERVDVDVRVVVTVRADRYDRPLSHTELAAQLRSAAIALGPMGADELAAAIVRPAATAGVEVEPALVAMLVDEAGRAPGALPLLQYSLTELFERRSGRVLRAEDHVEGGGLAGALSARAEDLVATLTSEERGAVRLVMLRLVQVGRDGSRSRRRVPWAVLRAIEGTSDELLDRLRSGRLLTADRDPSTREPTLEVAHESLFTAWPRLRHWLDDAERALVERQAVSDAALSWVADGRDEGGLLRGGRLDRALELAAAHDDLFDDVERELIAASAARRDRDERQEAEQLHAERRSAHRLRRAVRIIAIVAALALTGGSLAAVQWSRAERNAEVAAAQTAAAQFNALVTQALYEVEERPEFGLRLAIAAYGIDSGADGQRALLGAVTRVNSRSALLDAAALEDVVIQEGCPGPSHPAGTFVSVAPIPGVGSELVVHNVESGTVERATVPLECVVARTEAGVVAGALPSPVADPLGGSPAIASPDGRLRELDDRVGRVLGSGPRQATAFAQLTDGRLATLDLRDGQVADEFEVAVADAIASPDARHALIVRPDSSLSILELATGALTPLDDSVGQRAAQPTWSPDSASVVASGDGRVSVWRLDGAVVASTAPPSLRQIGEVLALRIAPDLTRVAVLGTRGLTILDVPTLVESSAVLRVRQPAADVTWLSQGQVAALGRDGVVEQLELDGSPFEQRTRAYPAGSSLTLLAPDVGAWDGPRGEHGLVDLRSGRAIEGWDVPMSTTLAPIDAERAVTWTPQERTIRVLDAGGSDLVPPIVMPHPGRLAAVAADGPVVRMLVHDERLGGEWTSVAADTSTGTAVDVSLGSDIGPAASRIEADGEYLWWSDDGHVDVVKWDGQRVGVPIPTGSDDRRAVVAPASGVVSVVRSDGTIASLDLESGAELSRVDADANPAVAALLIAGERLVVRQQDGDLALVDRRSGTEIGVLAAVRATDDARDTFNPVVATPSMSGDSIWFVRGTQFVSVPVASEDWLALACRLAPTPLTDAELRRWLPINASAIDPCQ